jgi:hypothetical protein
MEMWLKGRSALSSNLSTTKKKKIIELHRYGSICLYLNQYHSLGSYSIKVSVEIR